jgi:hypothetical protein
MDINKKPNIATPKKSNNDKENLRKCITKELAAKQIFAQQNKHLRNSQKMFTDYEDVEGKLQRINNSDSYDSSFADQFTGSFKIEW